MLSQSEVNRMGSSLNRSNLREKPSPLCRPYLPHREAAIVARVLALVPSPTMLPAAVFIAAVAYLQSRRSARGQ
ncbi:hypothetical protein BHE74_00033864 [Ensete ventricosum]|nr:hypothetical protein GW17_00029143 [Ensete ventricosum]RWW59214.1 hypothetical protein BHE74_00033864 [Ensete ventricosum]